MMLDQEALVAVLVAGVAHLRLEVLAIHQTPLRHKEIMEEAAQVKHQPPLEVVVALVL
jgi:hypothetical protein